MFIYLFNMFIAIGPMMITTCVGLEEAARQLAAAGPKPG
jgi:hypothetical protein